MDYLDYESTLPDMKRTFFSEFKFYTSDEVQDLIKNILKPLMGKHLKELNKQRVSPPLLVEVPGSVQQRLQG